MQKLARIVITLLCSIMIVYASESEVITYSDSWGQPGFSIESQNRTNLVVNFSINAFQLDDILIDGEYAKAVHIPGVFLRAVV